MPEPKKRIRGLINRNQATQFEQLGIELGPSPAQRAEEEKKRKLRERAMQAREAMAKWNERMARSPVSYEED